VRDLSYFMNFFTKVFAMRLFLMILFFALNVSFANNVYATNYPDSRIKRFATHTPRKVENNVATLTAHLTKPLDDDYDKAKMIAYWIASHINYDEYLYNNGGTTKLIKGYRGQDPNELLKSRVGICGDFAELFAEMCKKAGVKADIVHGYAYPAGHSLTKSQKKSSGHAWNYFKYKNKKVYVDTTFMADGRTGTQGGARNLAHRRALKSIERDNKNKSKVNDFDDYYFDFDYKREAGQRHYKHEEK